MAQINNTWGNYKLEYFLFPSEEFDRFNEYVGKYGGLSDYQIYDEINTVKGQVSSDVVKQHMQNLDAISQLQGFVDNHTRQRILKTKELLASTAGGNTKSNVETNYFGGSSLLLWFLVLVSIWRRPNGGFGWYW